MVTIDGPDSNLKDFDTYRDTNRDTGIDIFREIKELKENGKLKRIGKEKGGNWKIPR